MTPLETERLVLRPKRITDVDAMLAVRGDPAAVRFVGDGLADHYGGTYVKYRATRPRGTDSGSPSAARTSP